MKRTVRLVVFISLALLLCGCYSKSIPIVAELESEELDASRASNLVLTKRVALRRVTKTSQLWTSKKLVEVTAKSEFGKAHQVANVDCIVTGLRGILNSAIIISPTEFWEVVGKNNDELNLAALFGESYLDATERLDLDFVIAAYHQLIEVSSTFIENLLIEGIYAKDHREVAAAVVIDMRNRRIADGIQVIGEHSKTFGHLLVVIPFGGITSPENYPCETVGRYTAQAVARTLPQARSPRIAVVAAKNNPYNAVSPLVHPSQQTLAELRSLCRRADQGNPHAQVEIGNLYKYGLKGFQKDLKHAYMWYSLAAEGGYRGKEWDSWRLDEVREEMSPNEVIEAKALLKTWKPGQCEQNLQSADYSD